MRYILEVQTEDPNDYGHLLYNEFYRRLTNV